MTTLIPRMKHEGGKHVRNLFDHDSWKCSEDVQWDPITETETSPDDAEFDALFDIDDEYNCVPAELTDQFHQDMSQCNSQNDPSDSVGSLTTFNQPELRDEFSSSGDDHSINDNEESVSTEAPITLPTNLNVHDKRHVERVEPPRDAARVSL